MLTALMVVGCYWNEDPVRQSLDIDTSNLSLLIGESATRQATSDATSARMIYTSSKPFVALVDQNGKVTAMSEGETIIHVHMDETREDWYAAAEREYKVIVTGGTAGLLMSADRNTPLTLVAQADGNITVNFNGGITLSSDIYYSINGGNDQIISRSTSGAYDISVKKYDLVQFYSTNTALSSDVAGSRGGTRGVSEGAKYINIRPSMKTEIYGNVMSLLKGKDKFKTPSAIEGKYAFYGLFAGAENLVNNLLRHIELPAVTLTEGCYEAMFYGCKGIQRISELPANTLSKNCYKEMFADCSKLSYVRCLASDLSVEGCTKNWLANAGSESTAEKKVASTTPFPSDSNDGTPAGWTNLVLAAVEKVTLDTTELLFDLGDGISTTAPLTATVSPAYTILNIVFWSSSDESVATVSSSGVVTANRPGNAIITAMAGGKSATCKVTVKAAPVPSATITTAPTATTGDIITGSTTALVTAGTASGGTMMYKVTTANTKPTSTEGFSATVPTAESFAAGTYYVWYYAKADAKHTDSEISASGIEVTVSSVAPIPPAKSVAEVTTAPTATTGDIITGSTTALVTAGTASGGTMMYAVTTANTKPASTEGFSATVPTAESFAAGTYYVWFYAKADDSHTDSEISASVPPAKSASEVTTAPTATTGDIIAGSTTALVTAGTASGGTMMYKVTTSNTKPTSTEGFSAAVPTAESFAAGTYYVWFYAKADDSHTDSEISASVASQ